MSLVAALTTATIDDALSSAELPLLVDFWAPWCGPCKLIAPLLEEIAAERSAQLVVRKVNIDAEPALAERFNVKGLPTLIVFRRAQQVASIVGARGKSQMLAEIDSALAPADLDPS
jgi:thioredoxin 1